MEGEGEDEEGAESTRTEGTEAGITPEEPMGRPAVESPIELSMKVVGPGEDDNRFSDVGENKIEDGTGRAADFLSEWPIAKREPRSAQSLRTPIML